MKCSKTILASILAAAMIVPSVGVTAFAADVTDTSKADTAQTDVKYSVTAGYTWTIHSAIDFGSNAGVGETKTVENQSVSVSKNVIPNGKKLNIKVKGSGDNGAFQIKSTEGATLTYTIKDSNGEISANADVLNVAAGTNIGSTSLTFTLTTPSVSAETAGSYTGTVIYTASVVDAN